MYELCEQLTNTNATRTIFLGELRKPRNFFEFSLMHWQTIAQKKSAMHCVTKLISKVLVIFRTFILFKNDFSSENMTSVFFDNS